MVQVKAQKGYSLVEVLIALVILVSLMFTANYAYSMYSRYWSGRLGDFDQTLFRYQGLLQVKETIDSAIPYVVDDNQGNFTFYFLGRSEGFTLVTAAPIFAPTVNDAAVVRIFAEQVEGQYQLVYEEAPLMDELLTTIDQQLNFKYRTVLVRSPWPIRFEYFGWQQREHKFERRAFPNATAEWVTQYDAAITRIQPEKLTMWLGDEKLMYDLPVGHDRLINFYIDEGQR